MILIWIFLIAKLLNILGAYLMQKGGCSKTRIYLLKIVYLFLHVETSVTFRVLSIGCNTLIKTFFFTAQRVFELINVENF